MRHFKYLVMTGYFLFCRAKDLLAVDWYLTAKVRTNQNASIEQHLGQNSIWVRSCKATNFTFVYLF